MKEYHRVSGTTSNRLDSSLNEWAAAGWRVVAYNEDHSGAPTVWWALLERSVKTETSVEAGDKSHE